MYKQETWIWRHFYDAMGYRSVVLCCGCNIRVLYGTFWKYEGS